MSNFKWTPFISGLTYKFLVFTSHNLFNTFQIPVNCWGFMYETLKQPSKTPFPKILLSTLVPSEKVYFFTLKRTTKFELPK